MPRAVTIRSRPPSPPDCVESKYSVRPFHDREGSPSFADVLTATTFTGLFHGCHTLSRVATQMSRLGMPLAAGADPSRVEVIYLEPVASDGRSRVATDARQFGFLLRRSKGCTAVQRTDSVGLPDIEVSKPTRSRASEVQRHQTGRLIKKQRWAIIMDLAVDHASEIGGCVPIEVVGHISVVPIDPGRAEPK